MRRVLLMMLSSAFGYGCGAAAPLEAPVVVLPALAPSVSTAPPSVTTAPTASAARKSTPEALVVSHAGCRGCPMELDEAVSLGFGNAGTRGLRLDGGAGPPASTPPVGTAVVGAPVIKRGAVSNCAAVTATMMDGFRRCYEKGLLTDATMAGRVDITATIGPNGEVQTAVATRSSGVSATVIECVVARASAKQFAPPDGGTEATVIIPISFVRN